MITDRTFGYVLVSLICVLIILLLYVTLSFADVNNVTNVIISSGLFIFLEIFGIYISHRMTSDDDERKYQLSILRKKESSDKSRDKLMWLSENLESDVKKQLSEEWDSQKNKTPLESYEPLF